MIKDIVLYHNDEPLNKYINNGDYNDYISVHYDTPFEFKLLLSDGTLVDGLSVDTKILSLDENIKVIQQDGKFKIYIMDIGKCSIHATYVRDNITYAHIKEFVCYEPFLKQNYNHYFTTYDNENMDKNKFFRMIMETCFEMFDVYFAYIHDIKKINDPKEVKYSFLQNLGRDFGMLRGVNNVDDKTNEYYAVRLYRELLNNLMDLLKIRGTPLSYELFFGALGYDVKLQEFWRNKDGNLVEIVNGSDAPTFNLYDGTSKQLIYENYPFDPRTEVIQKNKKAFKTTIIKATITQKDFLSGVVSVEQQSIVKQFLEFLRPLHIEYLQELFNITVRNFNGDNDVLNFEASEEFSKSILNIAGGDDEDPIDDDDLIDDGGDDDPTQQQTQFIYTSNNGLSGTWIPITWSNIQNTHYEVFFEEIAYNPTTQQYVFIGSNADEQYVVYSSDVNFTSFTQRREATTAIFSDVKFLNGYFYIVGNVNGNIAVYRSNGLDFNEPLTIVLTDENDIVKTNFRGQFNKIYFFDGNYFALGQDIDDNSVETETQACIYKSSDGLIWKRVFSGDSSMILKAMAINGNNLIAVGSIGNNVFVLQGLSNSNSYEDISPTITGFLEDIIFTGSQWFAVGYDDANNTLVISSDNLTGDEGTWQNENITIADAVFHKAFFDSSLGNVYFSGNKNDKIYIYDFINSSENIVDDQYGSVYFHTFINNKYITGVNINNIDTGDANDVAPSLRGKIADIIYIYKDKGFNEKFIVSTHYKLSDELGYLRRWDDPNDKIDIDPETFDLLDFGIIFNDNNALVVSLPTTTQLNEIKNQIQSQRLLSVPEASIKTSIISNFNLNNYEINDNTQKGYSTDKGELVYDTILKFLNLI